MSTETSYSNETVKIPDLLVAEKRSTGKFTIVFIICFLSTLFGGVISMLMSVYLPVAVKDLLGNVSEGKMNDVSAWINAVFIFGWMFGGIAWGIICDKIGRSRSVALSTACFALFAIFTASSSSWVLVALCRFFSGFGIGGVLVTTVILIEELWSEKKKAIIQGIVSLAMPVGFFAAGAINNNISDWRITFYVAIVPLLLSILAAFILPESEKWKENKLSSRQDQNSVSIFDGKNSKALLTGSIVFGAMLIGLWAIFSWAPTWVQSISTSSNVNDQRGMAMMILAAGGITGSFFSGWIVNGIGLNKTMLMCFAACFIMSVVVFKFNNDISVITFAEMAVLAFFFGISQGALAVYIPALFATNIRASATGFCFNVGRLFTGSVVFFIGALVTLLGGYGNAVFVFSFVFVIGFITTMLSKGVNTN